MDGCLLGWNFLAPQKLQFDPPMAFVFWLFISNVNSDFAHAAYNGGAEHSGSATPRREPTMIWKSTLRQEREVEIILRHLEYQTRF